jgi:hypothetical protein
MRLEFGDNDTFIHVNAAYDDISVSDERDNKLKLMIEDTINRFNLEFVRPIKDGNSDGYILYAPGAKGMMAKGPELRLEIVPSRSEEDSSTIKIRVSRGKKNVFKDNIYKQY